MKRLLLILLIAVLAGFGWLATAEHPAPTRSMQETIPAANIVGE